MEESYAQALWKLVEGGTAPKKAVESVRKLLTQHGREGLLPKIAHAFKRLAAKELEARRITLSIAREKDTHTAHKQAKKVIDAMGAGEEDVSVRVDDSLIGGWRLEGREMLLDASFKKHLITLYNRATHA